ncbi:dTDP-4-dehydrorhamnose reductase [Hydromonas duriensis]|uniref:dTDP-4-dehydrorhamnose reductase n=1 Tax=Hydromonas duriensis TaxID=1527608 RepID=A0A4V3DK90_9BURK|nr:dTDP-4-dehydrorhamnose reductase [Hydromonas duriensis]TDR33160.1 dTDP-4-dehydrorhamnose reductase [Hydromonas duriensis]
MAHNLKKPRILITGTQGQVGFELMRSLSILGDIIAIDREQMDLTDPQAITCKLDEYAPHIIVNPAAHTAVDKAETDIENAYAINATAVEIMAKWAAAHDALLVHYSTDYVFDGTKNEPYTENDAANPKSVYGQSKLAGEKAVRAHAQRHFILRTSWVYGALGANFLKTMLRLLQTRDSLNIVNDQIGAPTSALLIADVTTQLIAHYLRGIHSADDIAYGTYHLTASGATSWHGYAQFVAELAEQQGLELKVKASQIGGIPSAEYPTPAQRPNNSRLDCHLLESTFNLSLPSWQSGVQHVFNLLQQG